MSQFWGGFSPFFRPYRRWKRSMRPAVSISFCFPVKNGWQAEHISNLISDLVERVSNLFPQAQVTSTLWYLGCIPSFISTSFFEHTPSGVTRNKTITIPSDTIPRQPNLRSTPGTQGVGRLEMPSSRPVSENCNIYDSVVVFSILLAARLRHDRL
jgi:hypothetical protein